MTKIRHYISSITQTNEGFIIVVFKEKIPNETILHYIKSMKDRWKEDGMPGEIPKDVVKWISQERFKNQFEMRFPFHDWKQNELRINDIVSIDMPLTIHDVIPIKEGFDV